MELYKFYCPSPTEFSNPSQIALSEQFSQAIRIHPSGKEDCFIEIIRDGKKYLSCTFPNCGKTFRYKSEFTRHRSLHVSRRSFTCPYQDCKKGFKQESSLQTHMRIHTGETPFKCEEPGCGQSFVSKSGLRYHRFKHNGDNKVYKCSFRGCSKEFWTISQLKQHENTLTYHKKMASLNAGSESHIDTAEPQNCDETSNQDVHSPYLETITKWEDFIGQDKKASAESQEEFGRMVEVLWDENNEMKMSLGMDKVSAELQEEFEKLVKVLRDENNAMKMKLGL